jgi:hypothetical protein
MKVRVIADTLFIGASNGVQLKYEKGAVLEMEDSKAEAMLEAHRPAIVVAKPSEAITGPSALTSEEVTIQNMAAAAKLKGDEERAKKAKEAEDAARETQGLAAATSPQPQPIPTAPAPATPAAKVKP